MQLSVATLLNAASSETRIDLNETLEFPGELGKLLEPVHAEITVSRALDNSLFRVVCHARARLELVCVRCLGPSPEEVTFAFDESLRVVETPVPDELVEDEVWNQGKLDLGDLVRQHLLLNLPARSLCGCNPAYLEELRPVDPRWKKLESLLKSPQEKDR